MKAQYGEPWKVHGPDDEPYGAIRIIGARGEICEFWQDDAPVPDFNAMQWGNARRAIACVNTLSGIPDEALDKVRELMEACRAENPSNFVRSVEKAASELGSLLAKVRT